MKTIIVVIILSLLPILIFGQQIVASDFLSGKVKLIKIGKLMGVTSRKDTIDAFRLFHYRDSTSAKGNYYWSRDGFWRFSSINTSAKELTITNDYVNVNKVFKFDEIEYLTYVKAKHPDRLLRSRITAFILGTGFTIVGLSSLSERTSNRDAIGWISIGVPLVSFCLLTRKLDKPKIYKFKGVR